MPRIGIIDDNSDQSGTLAKTISFYLKKINSDFSVVVQFPFKDLDNYLEFVEKNEVCVLILDEKLNDRATPEGGPVSYKGNELVTFLRERLKEFPIIMVSNYIDDDDLQAKFSQFDLMVSRSELTDGDDNGKFIPIIIRLGQRFLDSHTKELSEYNVLTQEIASGISSNAKLERLEALQVKLELPFTGSDDRQAWLNEYAAHIEELEKLRDELIKKRDGQ